MDDDIDLMSWGDASSWTLGAVVTLDDPTSTGSSMVETAAAVDRHLAGPCAPWMLWWHPRLGTPPLERIRSATAGLPVDAYHGGLALGTGGLPAEHDYIHPTTPFVLDPPLDVDGTCWRLSLGAALIRSEALRTVGGIDRGFHGATGAGLELGRRLLAQGGLVRSASWLVAETGLVPTAFDEHDRFLLLRRMFGRKWVAYAGVRRGLATRRVLSSYQGWVSSGHTVSSVVRPSAGLIERPPATVPDDPSVSVVLPTLGRYDLLRPLLAQLVEQTVPPVEILVVDQNVPEERNPELYAEFADRGVEVIWQEERGQWISRNAAVQRSRGEWIAFVDDDSEIGPTFVAAHLEGLARYRAALSTGASLAVVGAPVPDNYRFFRVADQWDSGNGMCHRSLFDELGLFDEQFDRQRRGDAEFGLRVQLHGGLVLHNPDAVRIHLKAESGGLRSYGSWDGFRHRDRSGPLPVPSMLYYTARYHSLRQRREDLFLGVVNSFVPYHLKRRARPTLWARLLMMEAWHLPSTVRRIRWSKGLAADMLAEGPRIPKLES